MNQDNEEYACEPMVRKVHDTNGQLCAMIESHLQLELRCDALLQRQDAVVKDMRLRAEDNKSEQDAFFDDVDFATRKLKGARFQWLAQLANLILPENSPTFRRRFVLAGVTRHADILGLIEKEVMDIQLRMREIEAEILESAAVTIEEIAAKMRFIVGLMLDGIEMETSYFAFQIEECAQALSRFVDPSRTIDDPVLNRELFYTRDQWL